MGEEVGSESDLAIEGESDLAGQFVRSRALAWSALRARDERE